MQQPGGDKGMKELSGMFQMLFWLLAKAYSEPGSGAMAVNFSLKLAF